MGQVFRITLRHNCGNIPKGTTLEVVTTAENDHSCPDGIPKALRKAGYADEDFQNCGISSSSNWEWLPIAGDSVKIHNELEKYWKPVESTSKKSSSSNKKKSKKSKSEEAGGDGKGFFGLDRWDPLNILLFIIFLPFLIVWWIIKLILRLCGIWAIINFFTGGDD